MLDASSIPHEQYSKNPQMRTYSFEMSLLVFLSSEAVPVIRVLISPDGPIQTLEIVIFDHIAFKYYDSIYFVPLKSLVDHNICVNLPISIMHVLFL